MLSEAAEYIREMNHGCTIKLFGQEINPESFATRVVNVIENKQSVVGGMLDCRFTISPSQNGKPCLPNSSKFPTFYHNALQGG